MTREIPLTNGGYTLVDDADYDMLMQFRWYNKRGYVARVMQARRMKHAFMHRVLLNAPAGVGIDHVNRNPLDNRRANLRFANQTQNGANKAKMAGCSSRFLGVTWHRQNGKWQAQIQYMKRRYYLGCFDDEQEAAKVRDVAAVRLFGEFASLNFTQDGEPL